MLFHERKILHIDMNSFFASVEQQANPFLRGKAIGVAHSDYPAAAILAASYEAKAYGVKTGTRVGEGKRICPGLIIAPMDTTKYYAVNRQMLKIFKHYTPTIEVYSIDEAFLDVTNTEHLFGGAEKVALEIKKRLKEEIGECLRSSIGIGPNKFLAKVGSNFKKPDGLTVISWENRFDYIDKVPIPDVWGIGRAISKKLAKVGIGSLRQVREMTDTELRMAASSYYTRLKLLANGEFYEGVRPNSDKKPPKSMQHAHTLSDATTDRDEILSIFRKQSERLGRRLRHKFMKARRVYISMIPSGLGHYGWGVDVTQGGAKVLDKYTDSGTKIYEAAKEIFKDVKVEQPMRLIIIGIGELLTADNLEFEFAEEKDRGNLNKAFDKINDKYGEFTLRSGDILYQYAKEKELSVDREDMTFHPGI
jgi:DNA polymerase IV